MELPREVFLSHASRDHRFATKLADTVRRHGVPVWYSPTHRRGSQLWHDQIGVALKRCDWFLLILSPNALRSSWVTRELDYALRKRRFTKKIIPVLFQTCKVEDLSWVLPGYQHVDFRHGFDKGCRELLRI